MVIFTLDAEISEISLTVNGLVCSTTIFLDDNISFIMVICLITISDFFLYKFNIQA